jgi:hypothetical protein
MGDGSVGRMKNEKQAMQNEKWRERRLRHSAFFIACFSFFILS